MRRVESYNIFKFLMTKELGCAIPIILKLQNTTHVRVRGEVHPIVVSLSPILN